MGNNGSRNEKLHLYHHHYGYFCQKVVMVLHEKKLPFKSHFINLEKGDQYQTWFLKLNSNGEVPVLKDADTGAVEADSDSIIEYLEKTFTNASTPRLIPTEENIDLKQKVNYFYRLINSLPAVTIMSGSFFHEEFVTNPKLPYIYLVRRKIKNTEINLPKILQKYAEKYRDCREMLLRKGAASEGRYKKLMDKEEYARVLNRVEDALDKVEEELSQHVQDKNNWWLCCENFTIADVALAIFLERLNQIGLETRYWIHGKRPHIEKYYHRVKQRDSFKKTMPSGYTHFQVLTQSYTPLWITITCGLTFSACCVILATQIIIIMF